MANSEEFVQHVLDLLAPIERIKFVRTTTRFDPNL